MRAKWSIYINGNNKGVFYNNLGPLRYKLENHFICYHYVFQRVANKLNSALLFFCLKYFLSTCFVLGSEWEAKERRQ